MDNVRVGIIGVGGMGGNHAKYLAAGDVPGATLSAVCDTSPAALERAKANYPDAQRFADADALIKSKTVDAVMIATPHYFHPPLAIRAMEGGLHALVEKPAGVYTKQVRAMNETAEKTGKVFGIMFQLRTSGYHQKMRELVQSGELGPIRRTHYVITDWFRTQSYYDGGGWRATWAGEGGGVLMNQAPHNLDLWRGSRACPRACGRSARSASTTTSRSRTR